MKALQDVIKQRDHKVKEIEKAERDIKDLIERARGLKRYVRSEQQLVNEYNLIIEHCKPLREETA
jgi:hypothetical protein